MPGTPGVDVGDMSAGELDEVIGWAADEGWNPGHSDATCFVAADPDGFLAARIDGRLVGSISAVRYGPAVGHEAGLAFIGLFIVRPELRGRGIGALLWQAALERVGQRPTGLDGVVAMQDSYARSGFVLAHRNLRFAGTLGDLTADSADVLPIGADDRRDAIALSTECSGAWRPDFVDAWLTQPGAVSVGLREGRKLAGLATARPCRVGYKVGPFLAADARVAQALLAGLRDRLGAAALMVVDVPEPNAAALDLVRGLGWHVEFETARMYRGADPGLPLDAVFGLTCLEVG